MVSSAIAETIGSLSKLLVKNNEWPEVFQFIFDGSNSDVRGKTIAMTLLSVVIEYLSKEDIQSNYDQIQTFIVEGLNHENGDIKSLAILSISRVAKATSNVKVLKSFQ